MNNKNKEGRIKVCMVTGNYFPEISGGTLQCRTLINALKEDIDFSVIATTSNSDSGDAKSLVYDDVVDGIEIYRVAISKDNSPFKINSLLRIILLFFKHRRNFKILHMHGFTNKGLLFIILSKVFRKKILIKITLLGIDDPYTIRKSWRLGEIKYFLYSLCDLVVSPAPYLTERACMARFPLSRLVEIPNGVDTAKFRPCGNPVEKASLRNELNLPVHKKIMLFVGYFCREKRADLILKAWIKARERWKDGVILVFIGSKDYATWGVDPGLVRWFDQQIKLYNMESELVFVEKTHCIEKYYRAADIFLFASEREGLPNALLEAMSSALPCIATNLKGITDTLINDGKDGLLVRQDDAAGIGEAFNTLLLDDKFAAQLGRNACEKIKKEYSINNIAGRYAELYKNMLS